MSNSPESRSWEGWQSGGCEQLTRIPQLGRVAELEQVTRIPQLGRVAELDPVTRIPQLGRVAERYIHSAPILESSAAPALLNNQLTRNLGPVEILQVVS